MLPLPLPWLIVGVIVSLQNRRRRRHHNSQTNRRPETPRGRKRPRRRRLYRGFHLRHHRQFHTCLPTTLARVVALREQRSRARCCKPALQ